MATFHEASLCQHLGCLIRRNGYHRQTKALDRLAGPCVVYDAPAQPSCGRLDVTSAWSPPRLPGLCHPWRDSHGRAARPADARRSTCPSWAPRRSGSLSLPPRYNLPIGQYAAGTDHAESPLCQPVPGSRNTESRTAAPAGGRSPARAESPRSARGSTCRRRSGRPDAQ